MSTQTNKTLSVVILISGRGSNLQAIIDTFNDTHTSVDIKAVISNRPDAYGLERAKKACITTHTIDHKAYADRHAFDLALKQIIDSYQPDLIVLAGFMRILTPEFVNHYLGRMINIHPSLLPSFPGLNTHQQALDAGVHEHGVSVHFVTPELDGGPVAIRAKIAVKNNDTAQTLAARVLIQERQIYPQAIKLFAQNRLKLKNNNALLDGQIVSPLTPQNLK